MTKYIIIAALLLLSFGIGRYSTPQVTKVDNKTVQLETVKTIDNTHIVTETKKIEQHKKDGSFTIETIINSELAKDTDTTKKDTIKNEVITTTTNSKTNGLSIDVLCGTDVSHPLSLVYGAHITNQLIGPIKIGAYGLLNGQVGVSLGLQF